MAKLENNFTWSASRGGAFDYCRRKYWWNYYGSWGGWEFGADPEVRLAYTLKNLHNRWTWAGTVVHETIEAMLRRIHGAAMHGALLFERPTFDVEQEVAKVTQRMRAEWRESRSMAYRQRPKKAFGLLEHEYEDDIPSEDWAKINARAKKGVRDFMESELFQRIIESDPHRWLPIEELDQFDFEGTPVWAVLDFGTRTDDDGIAIYDWKTGEYKKDAYRLQLGAYALYMGAKYDMPPERVSTSLVFLGDSDINIVSLPVSDEDLTWAKARMRASIAAMKEALPNPMVNDAPREAFPKTDDLEKCMACSFRRLCDRMDAAGK